MCYVLPHLLLLVIYQNVFARVPHGRQESSMLKLNHFIYELFSDVGYWVQMQRHHTSHLILEHFHEMDACVTADDYLIPQTRRLNLIDVADCLKPLSNVQAERAD